MPEAVPRWRQAFNAVEGTVAPALDSLVNSEGFAVAVGLAAQVRKRIQKQTERSTRRLLHFYNLPAGSDVNRLLTEIGQLQRQVRELSDRVESQGAQGQAQRKEGPTDGRSTRANRPSRPRSS